MAGRPDPVDPADAVGRLGGRPGAGIRLFLLLRGLMKSKTMLGVIFLILLLLVGGEILLRRMNGGPGKNSGQPVSPVAAAADSLWRGPDSATIPVGSAGDLILYGQDLIERT